MTDGDKAYVKEVMRIIKEHPLLRGHPLGGNTKHAIVLVSFKFYNAALEQVDILNEKVFGYLRGKNDSLWFWNALIVLPVPWLQPYEFELRPAVPPKKYSDEEIGILI